MESLQQNMSIALTSDDTDEIVGLRIIRIGKGGNKFDLTKYHLEAVKTILAWLNYKEICFDICNHYNMEEVFELLGLSVHREHRRKGLG